jgi:lysophospholipase L1-like esterase
MAHIALLGDSIFDNAAYVRNGEAVIDHFRTRLGERHQVSLLAIDGSVTHEVAAQLRKLAGLSTPVTHIVVSSGGNDALGRVSDMYAAVSSISEAATEFSKWQEVFRAKYRAMLDAVQAVGVPVAVATIYDCVPDLEPGLRSSLSIFNDVIVREANARRIPVIDIRLVCTEPEDYSAESPIEPSEVGGAKITEAIVDFLDLL